MASRAVEIETPDGVADAYLARPDKGSHPGVLFVMDIYGLRPTIEEMADRIALDGYVVLVPNVFYRAGRAPVLPPPEDPADPDQRASFFESARPLIEQLTPERIAADGAAYLDHLQRVAGSGRAAITGYCLGGRLGWRIAAAQPDRVAALGAFHPGGLVDDGADSPHLSADALTGVELCLGFADEDPSMSAEQIETLERALEEAGVRFHADVYAGARHGFTMEDSPAFDEAARERQFRELGALLKRTLG